jgi:hypothetical protein
VHSVGPVSFSWSNHPNITGIIYAGAPGEQTGPSLVDVLSGAYNPSGRLPFSIADVRPGPLSNHRFVEVELTTLLGRKCLWNENRLRQ